MKLGEWKPVVKAPLGRQDMCATATKLVAAVPRSGRTKLFAWPRLDAAPILVGELDGFVVRLQPIPGTDTVVARVSPSWPFMPDGAPLGQRFDDAEPLAMFEQKRAALARLDDDTVFVIVDTETGMSRELARSTPTSRIGDLVAGPDGVAFAISGHRRDERGDYVWSTRIVDGTGETTLVPTERTIDSEALLPHSWDASGLVLISRIHRVPRYLYQVVEGAVERMQPAGLVSPDGAYRVRLENGVLTVAERDHAPRAAPADNGLAKRALTELGTLPSNLLLHGGAWWWGSRRLVLGDSDPQVLDLETATLSRLIHREADRILGDEGGRWLVVELANKLHWAVAS
jgi:hypothetical protein